MGITHHKTSKLHRLISFWLFRRQTWLWHFKEIDCKHVNTFFYWMQIVSDLCTNHTRCKIHLLLKVKITNQLNTSSVHPSEWMVQSLHPSKWMLELDMDIAMSNLDCLILTFLTKQKMLHIMKLFFQMTL